jgi:hypothetical protein
MSKTFEILNLLYAQGGKMKKLTMFVLVLMVVSSLLTACAPPKPSGEIIFSGAYDNVYNWVWSSAKSGAVKEVSWLNSFSADEDSGVQAFFWMNNPEYFAALVFDGYDNQDGFRHMLAIFKRSDYANPVAITTLDPTTQEIKYDFYDSGQQVLVLTDISTTPPTINLWSFDIDGSLTKIHSLGPVRGGADTLECAKYVSPDTVYLSPDGKNVYWQWEYFIGGNCVHQNPEMMGPMFTEVPEVKLAWVIADLEGQVIVSDEKVKNLNDFSLIFDNPIGWAGNHTLLFDRYYPSEEGTEPYQCLYSVDINGEARDLYCDNDISPGIEGFSISPNGKDVAFIQNYHDLLVVEINTAKVIYSSLETGTNLGYPFHPIIVWSPDSQWLTWTMDRDSPNFNNSLFVMKRDGTYLQSFIKPEGDDFTYTYLWLK